MSDDNHYSSLLRGGHADGRALTREEQFDPYWNIEVCSQCGGSGQEASGVEYYGQQETVGCEACYGIGYTNERIVEILDHLENLINDIR